MQRTVTGVSSKIVVSLPLWVDCCPFRLDLFRTSASLAYRTSSVERNSTLGGRRGFCDTPPKPIGRRSLGYFGTTTRPTSSRLCRATLAGTTMAKRIPLGKDNPSLVVPPGRCWKSPIITLVGKDSSRNACSAMCLAGREHSPTVKQKEEKQQQKQPLPMARATERSILPFPLCGLAAHGSSTPTGG